MIERDSIFTGKRITQMGLGLLGRGLQDAQYLAVHGALLHITDLKTEDELAQSLEQLREYDTITYRLGEHVRDDFVGRDMILKGPGVPLNSPYIEAARAEGIPVYMDETLFLAHAPDECTVIGVTGTRGKTTVSDLIYTFLREAGYPVHLAGNVPGGATLPLLDSVSSGDYIVLELSSWQLQGFHEMAYSPAISVFTTFMPDHLNYYPSMAAYFHDKQAIYAYQKEGDMCFIGPQVVDAIAHYDALPETGTVVAPEETLADIHIPQTLLGEHNRYNVALAVSVAQACGVPDTDIQRALDSYTPVSGRLSLLTDTPVPVYNDNNATTFDATIAALRALQQTGRDCILICGGADKGVPIPEGFARVIEETCGALSFVSGSGTERIKDATASLALPTHESNDLAGAVSWAFDQITDNTCIIFSPGCASFSHEFANEYEREAAFISYVRTHTNNTT